MATYESALTGDTLNCHCGYERYPDPWIPDRFMPEPDCPVHGDVKALAHMLADAERKARKYQLAYASARRRARTARTRGLVDAENAIREEARASGQQLNRLVLGLAARLVADLQERR